MSKSLRAVALVFALLAVILPALSYRKPKVENLDYIVLQVARLDAADSLDCLIDTILGKPATAQERYVDSLVRAGIELLHQDGHRRQGMAVLRKAVGAADTCYGPESERYLDIYALYHGKREHHMNFNPPDADLYRTDIWLREQLKQMRRETMSEEAKDAKAYLGRRPEIWSRDWDSVYMEPLPTHIETALGAGNPYLIEYYEKQIRLAMLGGYQRTRVPRSVILEIYNRLIPHYEAACGHLSWQRLDAERRRILCCIEASYSYRHPGFNDRELARGRRFLTDWEAAGLVKTFGYWQAVHVIAFLEYSYAHNYVRAAYLEKSAITACDHLAGRLFISTDVAEIPYEKALAQTNPQGAKVTDTRPEHAAELALAAEDWVACQSAARKALEGWEEKLRQPVTSGDYAASVWLLKYAAIHTEALAMRILNGDFPADTASRWIYTEILNKAQKDVRRYDSFGDWMKLYRSKRLYESDPTFCSRAQYDEIVAEMKKWERYMFKHTTPANSAQFDYLHYASMWYSAVSLINYMTRHYDRFRTGAAEAMTLMSAREYLNRYHTHGETDEKFNKRLTQRYLISLSTLDDKTKFVSESRRILDGIVDELRLGFSQASKTDRARYLALNRKLLLNTLPVLSFKAAEYPEACRVIYDDALLVKGLQLKAERSLSQFLIENGDSTGISLIKELNIRRAEGGISQIRMDSIQQAIVNRAAIYGDYTDGLFVRWQQVRDALAQDEAAVEFFRQESTGLYMALVLRPGDTSPRAVQLPLESRLTAFDFETTYTTDSLSRLVWQPLQPSLDGVKTVYFSPIGVLNNIAIEYMPMPGGMDCALYRMSSTGELSHRERQREYSDIAVFGGAEYDNAPFAVSERAAQRSADAPDSSFMDNPGLRAGVGYLPGTLAEANSIAGRMGSKQTRLYTGCSASEPAFKALSGSGVELIHVATHGFYWSEREARRRRDASFLNADGDAEDRALNRSGLLLSGANLTLRGSEPAGDDDGVLTAREISALDLRSVRLAVLSACQTGVGDVSSEGVFGLQRGLKKAGVKSIMMSLWKVEDEATTILMTQFYSKLKSGAPPRTALAHARRYLRNIPEYSSPRCWASFVILD